MHPKDAPLNAPAGLRTTAVTGERAGVRFDAQDPVAQEVPVAMEYNGVSHAVMLATPADLEDFAYGFSLTEGIIDTAQQVRGVEVVPGAQGITVQVEIASSCFARLKQRRRQLSGRSGCGLCGVESLAQVMPGHGVAGQGAGEGARQGARITATAQACVQPAAVLRAMASLRERQPLMDATGATHAAAWATWQGDVAMVREDIGRHNALDKVIGALLRGAGPGGVPAAVPGQAGFAIVTSRASYELVHKVATAGIGMLAAISGPTTLAIEHAQASGVTLACFTRGDSIAVYSHPQRMAWTT